MLNYGDLTAGETAPSKQRKENLVTKKKVKVASMLLFANGNIAAFNERGEQIPELQMRSAIELWAEHSDKMGFDVDGCQFTTQAVGRAGHGGVISEDPYGFSLKWGQSAKLSNKESQ